jgi:hypothetical protein
MEGTVISDAVNLTSRLEGLTKPYGVSIIVSEQVLAGIENVENYKYRFLDTVKVKGKNNSVSIFEVFDADPPELIDLKIKTLDDLKMAVELYQSKRFSEANECFLKILEINSQDTVANLYLKRCEKLLKYGIPEEWTGIESMEK